MQALARLIFWEVLYQMDCSALNRSVSRNWWAQHMSPVDPY